MKNKKRFYIFMKMGLIYGSVFAICLTLLATIINYKNQKSSTLSLSKEVVTARSRELSMGNIELKGIAQSDKDKLLRRNDELGETAYAMEELIAYLSEKEEIAKQMSTGDFNVTPRVAADTDNFGIAYKNLVESLNTSLFNVIKASEQVDVGSNQVAQSNTASAEESASAAEELAGQAQELKTMVKKFKLLNNAVAMNERAEISNRDRNIRETRLLNGESGNAAKKETGKDSQMKKPVNPKDVIRLDDADFGKF